MGSQEKIDTSIEFFFDDLTGTDEDYAFTNGLGYHYQRGVWRPIEDKVTFTTLFDAKLKGACEGNGAEFSKWYSAIVKTLETVSMSRVPPLGFDADPNLYDRGPYLVTPNGTLDLGVEPVELLEWQREHGTTQRIDIEFDPKAECPEWLATLHRMLESDGRTEKQRWEIIHFLQEWVGVNLVGVSAKQTRGLKSGLIIDGPSYTGKSTFADMFKALIGENNYISPKLDTLSSQFGKSILIGNKPLISDDGIEIGSKADASVLKRIITGEDMTVDRKGMSLVTLKYTGAVLWTTNTLPDIHDESDAVYNRFVLVRMARVFSKEEGAKTFKNMSPIDFFRNAGELPGVLNWALEGYGRAYDRGHFKVPKECALASHEFRMENDKIYAALHKLFRPSKKKGVWGAALAAIISEYALTQHQERMSIAKAMRVTKRTASDVYHGIDVEDTEKGPLFHNLQLTQLGKNFWAMVSAPERKVAQLKHLEGPEEALI